MNGRNFLELALLVPGVSPTNIASTQLFPETSAVPGISISVGSQRNLSNNFVVDGLSANDDAAATERHHVRRRCGRAVPGRHVRRAGRARPRARRLHQRRHQERHQHVAGHGLRLLSATIGSTRRNALSGTRLPMDQSAVRRQRRRADPARIARSTSSTSKNARSIRPAWSRSWTASVAAMNARLERPWLRRPAGLDRHLPEPGRHRQRACQGRSPGERPRSAERALQPLRRERRQLARRRRVDRADAPRTNLDNLDQAFAVSNTLILSPRTVLETRAQLARGDLEAPPDGSDRARGEHCRRGVVRHELEQPDGPAEPGCTRSSTTSRTSAALTRFASGVDSSTTTT